MCDDYITIQQLKLRAGWTPEIIKQFNLLPAKEDNGTPLYDIHTILYYEWTKEFKDSLQHRVPLKQDSNVLEFANTTEIIINNLPPETLKEKAIYAYNKHHLNRGKSFTWAKNKNNTKNDAKFISDISYSYFLYGCTNYKQLCMKIDSMTKSYDMKRQAKRIIVNRINKQRNENIVELIK